MGKVLMEKDHVDTRLFTYIYAGDQRIAMYDKNENLHFYLNDHLGSARVVIDSTGTGSRSAEREKATMWPHQIPTIPPLMT